MAGVNKAIIMGHLGRDPEMRYMNDGKAVATLNIATSNSYKDKDGNKQETTEWHRVVLWGRIAEIAGEYLRKGSMAYVEGRLQTRKWTDKEGQEKYTTEIVADRMQLVGGNNDNSGGGYRNSGGGNGGGGNRNGGASHNSAPAGGSSSSNNGPFDDFDDDIPF